MTDSERRRPGLDFFWQQADDEGSGEHPLERELAERTDALVRYRILIADAEAAGRDEAAEMLLKELDREQELVEKLRSALEELRKG